MNILLSEAARLLDKSESQVRYMIKSGRLQARKAGGRWRIRREDLPLSAQRRTAARQGWDLAPKAMRRFRRQLPTLARGDLGRLERSLAAWRGVMAS